jgi:hypothetical protein
LDILENILATTTAILSMGGLGYYLGVIYQKRILNHAVTPNKTENNTVIRQRLMNVRNHTMRLQEVYSLRKRVDDFDSESAAIDHSIDRLEITLDILHKMIEDGDEILAETVLTRFSKHLRQLLHECASPEIEVSVHLEHINCILALLCALNHNKWSYEMTTEALADIDLGRSIKSMTTSPWIFEKLWDSVLNVGAENVIKLEISSDTYSVRYNLESIGSIHFFETKLR